MKKLKLKKLITDLLTRIFCNHTGEKTHLANFYGDSIIDNGWNRSLWKCKHCNALVYSKSLHYPPNNEVK